MASPYSAASGAVALVGQVDSEQGNQRLLGARKVTGARRAVCMAERVSAVHPLVKPPILNFVPTEVPLGRSCPLSTHYGH